MDINDIRGLGNVAALIAFLGVIWWAYGSKRKTRFEEDGNLPFVDEQHSSSNNARSEADSNTDSSIDNNDDCGGSTK